MVAGVMCDVTLVEQLSIAPCIQSINFGCATHGRSVWVHNCRGMFQCTGEQHAFACGFPPGLPRYNCSCASSRPAKEHRKHERGDTLNTLQRELVSLRRRVSVLEGGDDGNDESSGGGGQCHPVARSPQVPSSSVVIPGRHLHRPDGCLSAWLCCGRATRAKWSGHGESQQAMTSASGRPWSIQVRPPAPLPLLSLSQYPSLLIALARSPTHSPNHPLTNSLAHSALSEVHWL